MRIIQISDSHISLKTPQRLDDLKRCVEAVNAQSPDLVVHTGDIAHDANAQEYQQARSALDELSAPYFVMPGNRDNRSELVAVFSDRLVMLQEFIQYSLEDYPVRMLMIDTVSTQSNKGRLCNTRLQHIKASLEAGDSRPLIVFMHHTPFEVTEIPDPFQFEDWSEVETLTGMFAQCEALRAVYCGHVHRNVGAELKGLPVTAITCMACDLRKGQITDEERQRPEYKVIDF